MCAGMHVQLDPSYNQASIHHHYHQIIAVSKKASKNKACSKYKILIRFRVCLLILQFPEKLLTHVRKILSKIMKQIQNMV